MNHPEARTLQDEPTIAKAKLLTQALNAASRAACTPLAHAVLAHLIADAWPAGSAWAARTPIASLSTRLGRHRASIRTAIQELRGIVDYIPGKATRRSVFVVRQVGAPAHQGTARQRAVQRCAGAPFNGAPARHIPDPARSAAPAAGSAAAEGASTMNPHVEKALAQTMLKKPDWLPEGRPWLDFKTALELAQLPAITIERIQAALSLTRQRRLTLDNPAGYFITTIRGAR